jgi:predicted methyltransferase
MSAAGRFRAASMLACALACTTAPACTSAEPPVAADAQPQTPILPRPKDRLFSAQDLGLLDAEDRNEWQKPDQIMDALKIAEGSVVADLGAGGGWFTIRLAHRVEQSGKVLAEDIQPIMLVALRRRIEREGLKNVRTVLGTANDPQLRSEAPQGVDAVLIVDTYHEIEDPLDPTQVITLLRHVAESLKPQGCLGVVDFEPGGGGPGPDPEERVNPDAVIRAGAAAGLKLVRRESVPPFQFLLVFGKAHAASRCAS